MIKRITMACTLIQTELNIGEAGNKISSMAMALKHGLIKQDMKEIMLMEEKKGEVNLLGQMAPTLMESSRTIIFTAKEFITGVMEEDMMETGAITRCTEWDYLHGAMEENMKANMLTIKKKERVRLHGLMEESILEAGRMANSMETEITLIKKEM